MSEVEFGWTEEPAEREARVELVRSAWQAGYGHIFTPREINAIHDGDVEAHGSWLNARRAPAGTLAARRGGRLIGLAGLGMLSSGDGELAALYVAPAEQRRGVGTELWRRSAAELARRGCPEMEVWTLARADAWRFYEARGCRRIGTGTFDIPGHREAAIGYALTLSGSTPSTAAGRTR